MAILGRDPALAEELTRHEVDRLVRAGGRNTHGPPSCHALPSLMTSGPGLQLS